MASHSTPPTAGTEHAAERGQMVVLFALCLVVIIAAAGLLIDGGMASATRRQAQNAADTAALAAAKAVALGLDGTAAAQSLSASNGFPSAATDCAGNASSGVTVNKPPTAGAYSGSSGYIEVITQRAMRTGFAGIVGQGCWMVSARAVAAVSNAGVATCSFCALDNTSQNHTLVLQNSAVLRVDGDIYVNSTNGGTTPNVCTLKQWNVCGDAFDVFGTGGSISARSISVVGGWETHDQNIATADTLAQKSGANCREHPNPPSQAQTANVCIHMPVLADPLNDPANAGNIVDPPSAGSRPVAGENGCPSTATSGSGTSASPALLTISTGTPTICPGTYFGGIKIMGSASVTMQAGVYNIVGGGFQVIGSGSVDGSAGVMIYNSSGTGEAVSTTAGSDHVPAPITGHKTPKLMPGLVSDGNNSAPGGTVTYTITIDKAAGSVAVSGTVDFYDGNTIVCPTVTLVSAGGTKMSAICAQTYAVWGTHAMSAVYGGDSIYNGIGDTLSQVVKTPAGTGIQAVTISTTGTVKIYGPTSGEFQGLTIFQDRTSNLTLTLAPGSSGVTCPSGFMTATIAAATANGNGCGAIGGLQGTIYTAGAAVLITAGGLSPLQVISDMIEVDSGANARFAYNGSVFANGHIRLVE